MKLSIIIPAYNEEKAISWIINKCLAAGETIARETPADQVEIIVVSDGSSDQTAAIAEKFQPQIKLISYPDNRGYGAAIKTGFAAATGELVSFLDADGTCDPLYFVQMVNKLIDQNADVCIGNRLTPGSKMPRIRRIGNTIYATLVSMMGAGRVTDIASGMRVIRKSSLDTLYPLPDGLDFTPAMSCRAVLEDSLKIVDVPIAYSERTGKSKLKILNDGFRFLSTITDMALIYRTFRVMASMALVFFLLCTAYGIPLLFKLAAERKVDDWIIYRAAFILSVGVGGFTLFNVGLIGSRLIRLIHKPRPSFFMRYSRQFDMINQKSMSAAAIVLLLLSLFVTRAAIFQYVTTGHINVHWSRIIAGAFLLLLAFQLFAFSVLDRVIMLLSKRILRDERPCTGGNKDDEKKISNIE